MKNILTSKKVQFGLIIIIGCVLLGTAAGCTLPFLSNEANEIRNTTDGSTVDHLFRHGMVIMDDTNYQRIPKGDQHIKDAWIERDTLKIWVSYAGGCTLHEFALIGSSTFENSIPPQISFFLAHTTNGDHCKALIEDILSFDMSVIKENYRTQYHTNSGTITLWVDGWNQSLMYQFGYDTEGIYSPQNGSFLTGQIGIGVQVPFYLCRGVTKLYIDSVYVATATLQGTWPNPLDPLGNSKVYFSFEIDTAKYSEGIHEIKVLGKHNEYIDSIHVTFYNNSKVWHEGTIRNESRMNVPFFTNGSPDYANATFKYYWVIDIGMLEPIEWGRPILVYPINLPDEYKIDSLKIRYTMKAVLGYIPPIGKCAIELLSIDDFKRIVPQGGCDDLPSG